MLDDDTLTRWEHAATEYQEGSWLHVVQLVREVRRLREENAAWLDRIRSLKQRVEGVTLANKVVWRENRRLRLRVERLTATNARKQERFDADRYPAMQQVRARLDEVKAENERLREENGRLRADWERGLCGEFDVLEHQIEGLRSLLRECVEYAHDPAMDCPLCTFEPMQAGHNEGCPWPRVVEEVQG